MKYNFSDQRMQICILYVFLIERSKKIDVIIRKNEKNKYLLEITEKSQKKE